jgi:hypothetical protein
MRGLTIAAIATIALSLLAGCSANKATNQATGSVPPVQQISVPPVQQITAQAPSQQNSSASSTDGWVPVMLGNEPLVDAANNQYLWHPPSLKRDGNQVTYLTAVVYNTSDPNQPKVSLGEMTANCQTRSFHAISGATYNSSRQVITTVQNTPETIAQPGSINEVALMNICNARQMITEADLVRIQLEQLNKARQTDAEVINAAMMGAAKMFK